MNITCPNCSKKLKLNSKIIKGIKHLGPGRVLRLNCPGCEHSIALDASQLIEKESPSAGGTAPVTKKISPPSPPDISWLKDGLFEEEEVVEDVPQTMIMARPGEEMDTIARAVESIGYQVSVAKSEQDAVDRMQFTNYASVILLDSFTKNGYMESPFHHYMREMTMQKRRFIFYILIGSSFSTLYDLEALASSANLVVNNREIPDLLTILRKAIPKYEELFGSLMAEISAYSHS